MMSYLAVALLFFAGSASVMLFGRRFASARRKKIDEPALALRLASRAASTVT